MWSGLPEDLKGAHAPTMTRFLQHVDDRWGGWEGYAAFAGITHRRRSTPSAPSSSTTSDPVVVAVVTRSGKGEHLGSVVGDGDRVLEVRGSVRCCA